MKKQIAKLLTVAIFATILFASPSIFAEEELKTFGEWCDVYVKEHQAACEKNSQLPDIERGAAFALTATGQNPSLKRSYTRKAFAEIGKQQLDAYQNFIESDKCKSMQAKWKKDGKLAPEDVAYQWLIFALQTESSHFNPTKDKNIAKTIAGIYTDEKISRSEMDAVRFKLVQMGKCKGWTSGNLMPTSRGILGWKDYIDLKKHYPLVTGIMPGTKVPNAFFKRFDSNAEIKDVEFRSSLEAFLTPQGVLALHEYIKNTISEEQPAGYDFDLYSELDKGKPIFFLSHATQNTFDYIPDMISKHVLYDLFKNDVTFLHHTYDVRWDHDYGGSPRLYLPEIWKNLPVKGTGAPHSGYQYQIPEENWDAEIRDWGIMRFPMHSMPILKDRRGINRIKYGMHVKAFYFFDVNKAQCVATRINLKKGRDSVFNLLVQKAFFQNANKGLIPGGSYLHVYIAGLRMNILFMKIMERLDWKYDPNDELLKEYYKELDEKFAPYQDFGIFKIRDGIVESIDKTANTISIKGTVRGLKKAQEKVHVLDMGQKPRVCYETEAGREADGVQADGKISAVKPGDKVHAMYQLTHGTESRKILRSLMVGEKVMSHLCHSDLIHLPHLFWVTGKITAIDKDKGVCTVSMPKPNVGKGEWAGFKYWQDAMEKFGTKLPERGTTRDFYLTGKPMLEGDDKARIFNLNIDSAVEISVNGIIQYDMSGIKVDDKVSFSFTMFMKNKHPNYYPWHLMVVTKDKLTSIPMHK